MLTGNMGGCIGDVSSILLIAGGVFLLVRRVITWQIPVAYIGTVALVTFLLPKGGGIAADFMLYELLSGGLMLGAIFMEMCIRDRYYNVGVALYCGRGVCFL